MSAWLEKVAVRAELNGHWDEARTAHIAVASLSRALWRERRWAKYGTRSIRAEFLSGQSVDPVSDDFMTLAFREAETEDYMAVASLADLAAFHCQPRSIDEAITETLPKLLTNSGYLQNGDFAQGIALRLRMLLLAASRDDELNPQDIHEELVAWKKVNVANEIRELLVGTRRLRRLQRDTPALQLLESIAASVLKLGMLAPVRA